MEVWRVIKGYPHYEVSNIGNVRSLDRIIPCGLKNRRFRGKPLRMRIKNYGYVSLTADGISNNFYVHRLVALMFIDNPENKPQINHIDGNKFNNVLSNLEWCTARENLKHAVDTGLNKNKGEDASISKLTAKQVMEIRDNPLSFSVIARKYSICSSSVFNIKQRKTWKHL